MSFIVIVPTSAEKTDFTARHGGIHPSLILINPDLYRDAWQEICKHLDTHMENGLRICNACNKPLEVLSYRD